MHIYIFLNERNKKTKRGSIEIGFPKTAGEVYSGLQSTYTWVLPKRAWSLVRPLRERIDSRRMRSTA